MFDTNKVSITIIMILAVFMFSSCSIANTSENEKGSNNYMKITPDEAKEIMDTETDYVILDVRTQEEYDEGHILGAVLIPDYEIADRIEEEVPDKGKIILVYCRSGNRSASVAKELASLGYMAVKDIGGIIDWPYDTTV